MPTTAQKIIKGRGFRWSRNKASSRSIWRSFPKGANRWIDLPRNNWVRAITTIDSSSSFRGDSSQICYGVLYFSFSHEGSNDFNAPIMSLFREIKRKLIIKQSEVSKRKSATELRSSRFPRINENMLYISSEMWFFWKIHLIIPLLSFLIDTRKKLHKNTTEAIPSANILRLPRVRLPTVKASINNIHIDYITRWQSSNGSLDTIECSIYCRKSLWHMKVFYFITFSQTKASSKRWISKFISQILLYMPPWYIHF